MSLWALLYRKHYSYIFEQIEKSFLLKKATGLIEDLKPIGFDQYTGLGSLRNYEVNSTFYSPWSIQTNIFGETKCAVFT